MDVEKPYVHLLKCVHLLRSIDFHMRNPLHGKRDIEILVGIVCGHPALFGMIWILG